MSANETNSWFPGSDPPNDRRPYKSDPGTINEARREYATGPGWRQLLLVVLLVTSLLMGPILLLKWFDPDGPWQLLPLTVLLVATESVLTRRWLDWPSQRRHRAGYSLAELVVLLSMVPFIVWLAKGLAPLPTSITDLLADPLTLLNVALVAYMVLVFLAWERAHSWSGIFIHMAISPHEVHYYSSSKSQHSADLSTVLPLKQRSALLKAFVRSWIFGGFLLVVIVAILNLEFRNVMESSSPEVGAHSLASLGLNQDILLASMAYFLGGLWLISEGRSVVLEGRWLADRSRRDSNVVAKWSRWALILIVGLAIVASLLPIGTTFPLLQMVLYLARVAFTIIGTLISFVFFLFYVILSWLPESEPLPQPPPEVGQLLNPEQLPVTSPVTLPSWLAGSLLWLAIIGLTIGAAIYYLNSRGPAVSLSRIGTVWRRLLLWIHGFGRETASLATSLTSAIRLRVRRPLQGKSIAAPFGFLRVSALPPRDQIRLLYLSMLRHAEKRGLRRPSSSTPTEFVEGLMLTWPEASDDLRTLTDAFIDARYSQREIDQRGLRSAKNAWLRLRRGLAKPDSPSRQETSV